MYLMVDVGKFWTEAEPLDFWLISEESGEYFALPVVTSRRVNLQRPIIRYIGFCR